jgi:hypothetical protein
MALPGAACSASSSALRRWRAGPRALSGLPFGAAVVGAAYVILPLAQLYKPIWEYDKPTLAKDLSSHLVYGAGVSSLFALLSRPK